MSANPVLTAPVVRAVYSTGSVVKDGNPLIIKYSKIKIEIILNTNIILFFIPIGILVKRLNRIERNLFKTYSKIAIKITTINAWILVSNIDPIFHHPGHLFLVL